MSIIIIINLIISGYRQKLWTLTKKNLLKPTYAIFFIIDSHDYQKKKEYKKILSKKRISMALQAVHCLVLAWCVSCAVVVCKIINNNKCLPYWLRSYFFKEVPINIKNFVNYLYNVSTSGSAEGMAHFWLGDFSIVVFTDFFYVQFIFLVFYVSLNFITIEIFFLWYRIRNKSIANFFRRSTSTKWILRRNHWN